MGDLHHPRVRHQQAVVHQALDDRLAARRQLHQPGGALGGYAVVVEGEQVILNLIAGLIETQYSSIITMEETDLMEYFRKDILIDAF
jgi:hypothetical protein